MISYFPLKNCKVSQNAAVLVVLTVLYFVIGKLGLLLAIPGTNVAPIYPASGLALAAVLVFGYRASLAIFLGSFLMNISSLLVVAQTADLTTIFVVSGATGIGAALQSIAGAALIFRFVSLRYFYDSAASVLKILGLSVASCLVNSNVGVLSLYLSGLLPWSSYFYVWWSWWVGDALGVVVVTPLILAWIKKSKLVWSAKNIVELLAIVMAIVFISFTNRIENTHLTYMYIPLLIWTAMRFQFRGAALGVLLVSIAAVIDTASRVGSFVGASLNASLLLLAIFIIVMASTILAVSAEFGKQRRKS